MIMDLEYSWNVSLVVFTLLTGVLVVATFLIVASLKRENRMFHKRLTRQASSLRTKNEEKVIDLSELKKLIKYNLIEKKNDKILDIQNYFLQIEKICKVKQNNDKILKRTILEEIRIQFMEHPMDMEGLKLSYLAGRLFLMCHSNQSQQLSKRTNLLQQQKGNFWSISNKILSVLLLMSIWIFVTVMDIMFICEFKKILIPQVFNNETMVSVQTSTVDLHFSLMVAHYLMYLVFFCQKTIHFWRKSKSSKIEKILNRYALILSQSFLSLPQFCLQLSGVCVTQTVLWSNLSSVLFSGISQLSIFLLLSSLGHFLSLTLGQYLGLMIQHQMSLSSSQRCLYLMASIFNSLSMMASSSLFITLLFLSTFWILSPYHILTMVILFASICFVSLIVKTSTFLLGIKFNGIDTVHLKRKHKNILTRIADLWSMMSINLFLPPSNVLLHPNEKFFPLSPLTPSMYHSMARQLISQSVLMMTNTVLLWNMGFQPNSLLNFLLIFGTVGIVPSIFCSYLLLYFYYNYFDIFNSSSIQIVFKQKNAVILKTPIAQDEDISDVENYQEDYPDKVTEMSNTENLNQMQNYQMEKIKAQNNSFKINGDWINTHISLS